MFYPYCKSGQGYRARWTICAITILLLTPCLPTVALSQSSERATQDYELHYTKGVAMFDLGEYDAARAELGKALEAKPSDNEASFYLALTNNRTKGYAAAETLLLKLLERDPTFTDARFNLGVSQFNLEKYEQALQQFSSAVDEDSTKPLPYFYQGLTLNKLERYSEAPPRFERSALLDPDLTSSAQYQSGIAYFRANLRDEAKDAFESVIATDPDSALGKSSRDLLEQVKAGKPKGQKKKKSWDLSFMVSPQYDDNVILQAPGGARPEDISRQDDYKTTMYGRGEFRFKETENMVLGASYSFYQSFHAELDEFDVQAHSPTLFGTYQMADNVRARMEYKLDAFSVGREAYMVGHSLNPMLMIAEPGDMLTQIQYRFQTKDFNDDDLLFPENSDRDGDNHLFGLTQFLLFAERQGNVRAGYTFDVDDTRSQTWDYQGHRFNVGLTAPPFYTFRLDTGFDYYIQDYIGPNEFSPTLSERFDDIMNVSVTVTKPIGESYSVGLQYLYTRNQSNIGAFDYNRSVFALVGSGSF